MFLPPFQPHHLPYHHHHHPSRSKQPPPQQQHHRLQPHPAWVYRSAHYAQFDPEEDDGAVGAAVAADASQSSGAVARILGPVRRSISSLARSAVAKASQQGEANNTNNKARGNTRS